MSVTAGMKANPFDVTPLSQVMATEVTGANLSAPVEKEIAAALNAANHRRQKAVRRGTRSGAF